MCGVSFYDQLRKYGFIKILKFNCAKDNHCYMQKWNQNLYSCWSRLCLLGFCLEGPLSLQISLLVYKRRFSHLCATHGTIIRPCGEFFTWTGERKFNREGLEGDTSLPPALSLWTLVKKKIQTGTILSFLQSSSSHCIMGTLMAEAVPVRVIPMETHC